VSVQDRSMQTVGGDESPVASERRVRSASARAPRLRLDLQLRYRPVGARRWHDGEVENISRSGVLFRGAALVDVNTPVEIALLLPVLQPAGAIVCRGRIVRTILPGGPRRRPGLAATISRYRFRHPKHGD
jgi:PilZ domain-containing protein